MSGRAGLQGSPIYRVYARWKASKSGFNHHLPVGSWYRQLPSIPTTVASTTGHGAARWTALLSCSMMPQQPFGSGRIALLRMAANHHIETLFVFAGKDGALAYTVDKAGTNLPSLYSPWRFLKSVSIKGTTFKAGSDKAALAEVHATGFSVRIYSIKFD